VDFVGSVSGIQSRCSPPSGFDANHEGHSGWQAFDIAKNNIDGWMRQSRPDVVNVLLGTNDINIGKRNAATIVGAYTSLLSSMRAVNPSIVVVVSFFFLNSSELVHCTVVVARNERHIQNAHHNPFSR